MAFFHKPRNLVPVWFAGVRLLRVEHGFGQISKPSVNFWSPFVDANCLHCFTTSIIGEIGRLFRMNIVRDLPVEIGRKCFTANSTENSHTNVVRHCAKFSKRLSLRFSDLFITSSLSPFSNKHAQHIGTMMQNVVRDAFRDFDCDDLGVLPGVPGIRKPVRPFGVHLYIIQYNCKIVKTSKRRLRRKSAKLLFEHAKSWSG